MNGSVATETRHPEFAEVTPSDRPPIEHLTVDDLTSVRLAVMADLGETSMTVRELLELKQGSVIPLNKLAGEMIDIYVNGVPLARGEVVVIADALHVRVAEILGTAPEEKEMIEDEGR